MSERKFAPWALNGQDLVRITPLRSGRHERRYPFPIPLLIHGFDHTYKLFWEPVSTLNFSRAGCCIRMARKPMVGSALALRVVSREGRVPDNPRLLFQVAWTRQEGESWVVGTYAVGDTDLAKVAFGAQEL